MKLISVNLVAAEDGNVQPATINADKIIMFMRSDLNPLHTSVVFDGEVEMDIEMTVIQFERLLSQTVETVDATA